MENMIPINNKLTCSNLSLCFFCIPSKNIFQRKETWDQTIDSLTEYMHFSFKSNEYLFYNKKSDSMLFELSKQLEGKNDISSLEIIHESSYLGFPHQLRFNLKQGDIDILTLFDGIMFYFFINYNFSEDSITSILQKTSLNYDFKNTCISFLDDIGFDLQKYKDPFWDFTINSLNNIGITNSPSNNLVFEIEQIDYKYKTITFGGDRTICSAGKNYLVFFSENKKNIRDRISNDMLIEHDLLLLLDSFNKKRQFLIKSNETLLSSLDKHTVFTRWQAWRRINKVSKRILEIESYLPKYEFFYEELNKFLETKQSFINVSKTIWLQGEIIDNNMLHQTNVSGFIKVKLSEDENIDGNSVSFEYPIYKYLQNSLMEEKIKLKESSDTAIKNLEKANTHFSTCFGFYALIVSIITLIVSAILSIISIVITK